MKGLAIGVAVFLVICVVYMLYRRSCECDSPGRSKMDLSESGSVSGDSDTSSSSSETSTRGFNVYTAIRSFMEKQAAYLATV